MMVRQFLKLKWILVIKVERRREAVQWGGWMSEPRGPITGCRCSGMEQGLSQKDGD